MLISETSPVDWAALADMVGSATQAGAAFISNSPAITVGAVVIALVILWLSTK